MKTSAKEGTLELNKTAKALMEIAGVDVYDDKKTGKVKDMVQVIDEVQKKWKDLREDERLGLSEAIAGKQQAMVFQSLMGNFETFRKMRDEFSQNLHLGSAEAENTQYVDSVAGKLNHLKEVWVSISQSMVSSDFTKGLLDGAIAVSEAIDMIVKGLDKVHLLTPALMAMGGVFSKMMKTMIGNSKNGLSLLTVPQGAKGGLGLFSTIKNDITHATTASGKLKESFKSVATAGELSFMRLGTGISSATKFMASFVGQGLMIAGVTMAVQLLAKGWDSMAHGLENTEKKIKDNIQELNASNKTHGDNLTYLDETQARYEELIAKKKEYGDTPIESMTEDQIAEMNELKNITSELAEMFPQLVMGYDANGSPILLMANDMEKLKEKTREQIQLNQQLLKAEREKLALNARKQAKEGNFFGMGQSTDDKLSQKQEGYDTALKYYEENKKKYIKALSDGNKLSAKINKEGMDTQKGQMTEYYSGLLEAQQKYYQEEQALQQNAFDRIQSIRGYDNLNDDQANSVNRFIDNLNWRNMDEGQFNSWINGSKKIIDLAQSGSPKLDQWNKTLEDANKKFGETGNLNEYQTSLKKVAEAISKDLNIDYGTALAGLENMVRPVDQAGEALDKFLATFKRTRSDVLSGDNMAVKLAEQFEAVNDVINNMLTNENAYKKNGALKYEMAIEIANKDGIPKQVQDLVSGLAKGGVTKKESDIIIDVMMALSEGSTKETEAKIEDVNKRLKEMGKEPIDIKTLFDTKGADDLENKLNQLREGKDVNLKIMVEGQDKAQLFSEMIEKLKTTPELTNKLILDNQDALAGMKTYEDVVKWLQANPEIVSKYKIEGIEKADDLKKKKQEVEKTGESKTVAKVEGKEEVKELNETVKDAEGEKQVDVKVNDGQVLDSIESIETLIKYSAQMKDGQYKLDIQANTADAVNSLEQLEIALKKVSNVMTNTPAKVFKIETAQASQNVTGLRNNVEKLQGLMSQNTALVFKSETAQASKNITGLINNAKRCMALKPKPIVFTAHTAQAAKNISGLINKINSVPTGTHTIRYNVVTAYSSSGTPSSESKGAGLTKSGFSRSLEPTEATSYLSKYLNPVNSFQPMTQPSAPVSTFGAGETSTPQTDGISAFGAKGTLGTPIAIGGGDIADALEFNIELLKELEARVKMVNNELAVLDKRAEHATGSEKIKYLKRQNELYKEKLAILAEEQNYLQRQQNYVKYSLENIGVKFNSDGNMTNYEELLIKKEKEVKALEQKANKEKASDGDKKKYESAKSALDDFKKYADEYYSLTFDELPKVKEEWEDLANSIRENAHAVKDLEREQALYTKNSKLKEISVFQDEIADKQDLINEKMKHASGEEKVKYYKQLIALSETDMKHQELKIKTYKDSLAVLQQEMKGFGFTFDANGSMENIDETLNKFQNSKDLEYVKKLMEEYITMQRNDLPEAEKNWQEMANSITDAKNAIADFNKEADKFKFDMAFTSAQKHVDELNNALEMLDVRLENAFGENKSELLQEKVDLLHKQKQEMLDVINLLKKSKTDLQGKLSNQGFKITDNGSIANYDSQMEKLKKSMSADDFAEIEQLTKSYLDLLVKELPEAERKWEDLDNAIIEHQNQLEKVQRQIKLDPYLNKIKEIENELDGLADKLDIIDIKLENAWGQDKLDLLTKQIELLEQQSKKQQDIVKQYEDMRGVYQNDLIEFGVKFDKDGDITNLDEILNKYQSHRDIEKLKELIDEYLNIQSDKLPDAVKEWEKLEASIKNAYKEQLNTTKQIEDQITEIYKKQKEERIKLIDEELKKRLDAINKEKEAYNKAREEAKYQDSYNEQMDKVKKLEKQLEIAKKDSSISGQKKVQELLDQLKEEQKKLQDMVQDKIDDQVNDMFDKENDRLEEEADKAKDDLEEQFSDKKIQELVKEALSTGVFEDIDGTMRSLQDVMLQFVDDYGDGLGATGELIKNELIANLEVAKSTMKDLVDIYKELGTIKYSYDNDALNNASRSIPDGRSVVGQAPVINFNESLVNIEGNIDRDIMDELKDYTKDLQDTITRNIVRELR